MLLEPGSDGDPALAFEPNGFRDWRWGAVYTIRPAAAMPAGRPYRLFVSVRRTIGAGEPFDAYAGLYERAALLTGSRIHGMGGDSWTQAHAWGRHDGAVSFAYTSLSSCLAAEPPDGGGLPAPDPAQLIAPGGTPLPAGMTTGPSNYFDEIYNDFDFRRDPRDNLMMFSHGEFVDDKRDLDFEPFLERAAARARAHYESLAVSVPFQPLRREWMTSGDANHLQVVVHCYFRVPGAV